ncbi:MAG: hypothetical protein HZT42_06950 [Paracoccaceae bacterium]|nr:MAG: hypothetical protein HZT42_06950 [Paracoccaceae bacterium]
MRALILLTNMNHIARLSGAHASLAIPEPHRDLGRCWVSVGLLSCRSRGAVGRATQTVVIWRRLSSSTRLPKKKLGIYFESMF